MKVTHISNVSHKSKHAAQLNNEPQITLHNAMHNTGIYSGLT